MPCTGIHCEKAQSGTGSATAYGHSTMADEGATQPSAGLLDQPTSWLHQLVTSLPQRDKIALFVTCMQLAMQVLDSSFQTDLWLNAYGPALPLCTRQKVISRLLATRKPCTDGPHEQVLCRFSGLTVETMHIVSIAACDCWLFAEWSILWEHNYPVILPALWAALHSSVSSVQLGFLSSWNIPNMWAGIPKTVKRLDLLFADFKLLEFYYDAGMKTSALAKDSKHACSLVTKTPEHVVSLGMYGLSVELKAACERAGIFEVAPKHLKLELHCD